MWKVSGVIGEGSDNFPIVEEIEAKKRGIRCAVYSKLLKLTKRYKNLIVKQNDNGSIMMSQIPKNYNYNAFTKVLLLRYNHNHGTNMYHCPLKG